MVKMFPSGIREELRDYLMAMVEQHPEWTKYHRRVHFSKSSFQPGVVTQNYNPTTRKAEASGSS